MVHNSLPFTLSLYPLYFHKSLIWLSRWLFRNIFLIMVLTSTISMFQNHKKNELDCVNRYSSSKLLLEEFVLEMKKTYKTRFLTPSYCGNTVSNKTQWISLSFCLCFITSGLIESILNFGIQLFNPCPISILHKHCFLSLSLRLLL